MTGPDHFRKAEEFAAKAAEYLGQGDGQDTAAVWAAVAQVHATLAVAAAFERTQTGSATLKPPPQGAGPKPPELITHTGPGDKQSPHPPSRPVQPPPRKVAGGPASNREPDAVSAEQPPPVEDVIKFLGPES